MGGYDQIMEKAEYWRNRQKVCANQAREWRQAAQKSGEEAELARITAMELEQAAALLLASLEGPIK